MKVHEREKIYEKNIEFSSKLNYAGVDEAADFITDYFGDKVEKAQLMRLRLSIEECLNVWCEQAGSEDEFKLRIKKKLNGYIVNLIASGSKLDPYEKDEKDKANEFSHRLLVELGIAPEYKRREGANELVYRIRKKPINPILKILCVIATAIMIGIIMVNCLPAEFNAGLNENLLTPVYSAFFRLLGTIAGPMIFLSVAWGIYGIGDVVTLGRIGKKLFTLFIITDFAFAIFALLGYPFLGPELSNSGSTTSTFNAIIQMLLDIIPSSIVQPFADGNTLQIILLAVFVGNALVYLGKRTETVALFIEQINYLVQYLMKLIASSVPYITFLIVLTLVLSGAIYIAKDSWKLLVVVIPFFFIALFILLIVCAIFLKASPGKMAKKLLPLFAMGISTASSTACFDINIETTRDKFGVDPSLTSFGVPLGMVVSRVGAVVYFPLMCFYFATSYNIEMSWQAIISLIITCVCVSIASPPISGGGIAVFAVLFTAVGIPNEAMAVAIAVNVLIDFVMTATNVAAIPLMLAVLAKTTGKLDREKLLK